MEIIYRVAYPFLLIDSPIIPDGDSIKLIFTGKHNSENSLDALGINAVSLLAASLLYDWLASQNAANTSIYSTYNTNAQRLRRLYEEASGLSCGRWATPALMCDRYDAEELAQRTDKTGLVNGIVLQNIIQRKLLDNEILNPAQTSLKRLCRVCKDADAIIDSYTSARVKGAVSLSLTEMFSNISCDIAFYLLHDDSSLDKDSVVRIRYDAAIKMLTEFRDGKFLTGENSGIQSAAQDLVRIRSARIKRKGY